MLSITVVWGSHNFGLRTWLGAQGGSTKREDFAGGSAVLPTLSEGLEIELSDFEAEDVTLKGDYLWQVVEIVIGVIPTILEVRFMCLFMSLNRILLKHSVLTNLFDSIRHPVDFQKVDVSFWHLGNTYLMADKIPPGIHFVPHLGRCDNDKKRPQCSSILHHSEIYIEHAYRFLTNPVCTQLCDGIWDIEQGFRLVETGLQLQAGTGSLPSSSSHSIEKLLHMTNFLMWGRGKQARITTLHCTCWAICVSSWSGKSTSGGGQASQSALYGWGQA